VAPAKIRRPRIALANRIIDIVFPR